MYTRRKLIAGLGVAASGSLAGCPSDTAESNTEETSTGGTNTPQPTGGAAAAVAAQWNVYRSRLYDAVALGRAGEPGAGASVAQSIFATFEGASGEYGAHEYLEETSHSAYEGFEDALGDLQSSLSEEDLAGATEAADAAAGQLRSAQRAVASDGTANALDLLWLAGRGANAGFLADAGHFAAAETVATEASESFEGAQVHDALEDADPESYEAFEGGLGDAATVAADEDIGAVGDAVQSALDAAVEGAYGFAGDDGAAGAGHLAAFQARGYDASVLAGLGGPGKSLAHAASLTVYRARAADAAWLTGQGESDLAATMAQDVFAHFEGAKAHEALEEADHEAYEGFEGGLDDLRTAIENGEQAGVDEAESAVDSNLVTGVESLAGENAPVIQSGYFRVRFGDARELYELGDGDAAADVVEDLFARFEENELDLHEAIEEESEDLYHRFEEEHLSALGTAFADGDDEGVATHYEGVQSALLEFEASRSPANASGAETAFMLGRGFDAAAVAATGNGDRAETIAADAFEYFEGGAAGFHDALEHADHDRYEAFEEQLGAVRSAAADDGDAYAAAKSFNDEGVAGIYAIVANAGGDHGAAAAGIVQDVFATFEEAAVHEALEEADHDAYENFESAMNDYASALESGDADPTAFANATRTAQFAVVGAVEQAPAGESGGDHDEGSDDGGSESLAGGPDVVEGVPDDADHVVAAKAVSFEPAELTVSVGDTVAFEHAGGEPHSVTATEAEIPEGATYWASGDFDSEEAARSGWKNGEGAVQSGQSYVHTFETAGEHHYVCIPHEAAGMTGVVVVEE